jgi:hypothetical protein
LGGAGGRVGGFGAAGGVCVAVPGGGLFGFVVGGGVGGGLAGGGGQELAVAGPVGEPVAEPAGGVADGGVEPPLGTVVVVVDGVQDVGGGAAVVEPGLGEPGDVLGVSRAAAGQRARMASAAASRSVRVCGQWRRMRSAGVRVLLLARVRGVGLRSLRDRDRCSDSL